MLVVCKGLNGNHMKVLVRFLRSGLLIYFLTIIVPSPQQGFGQDDDAPLILLQAQSESDGWHLATMQIDSSSFQFLRRAIEQTYGVIMAISTHLPPEIVIH